MIVGAGGFAGGVFIELARAGAVIALVSQVIVELRSGRKQFLTSPLFLLSVIGVVFFSAVQVPWGYDQPWPSKAKDFTVYVGSQAEAVILAFCMASLVAYLFASGGTRIKNLMKGQQTECYPIF